MSVNRDFHLIQKFLALSQDLRQWKRRILSGKDVWDEVSCADICPLSLQCGGGGRFRRSWSSRFLHSKFASYDTFLLFFLARFASKSDCLLPIVPVDKHLPVLFYEKFAHMFTADFFLQSFISNFLGFGIINFHWVLVSWLPLLTLFR